MEKKKLFAQFGPIINGNVGIMLEGTITIGEEDVFYQDIVTLSDISQEEDIEAAFLTYLEEKQDLQGSDYIITLTPLEVLEVLNISFQILRKKDNQYPVNASITLEAYPEINVEITISADSKQEAKDLLEEDYVSYVDEALDLGDILQYSVTDVVVINE